MASEPVLFHQLNQIIEVTLRQFPLLLTTWLNRVRSGKWLGTI